MLRLALAFLLFGAALTILAVREQAAVAPLQEEPQEVSLKALLGRGPQQNPHVVLKDFEFADRFAFAEKSLGRGWRAAWFPIVPPVEATASNEDVQARRISDGPLGPTKTQIGEREGLLPVSTPTPNQVRAVIMTERVAGEAQLHAFLRQRRIDGRASLASESLDKRDRELLQQKFPGIKLEDCLIIQADDELRGAWLFYFLATAAGLCYVISVGLVIASRRQCPPAPPTAPGQASEAAEQLDAWQQALARRKPPAG